MLRVTIPGEIEAKVKGLEAELLAAGDKLQQKTGAGADFLGWVHLPESYDKDEFKRIGEAAKRIRSMAKALVVIGIGGSYLGARAVIDYLGRDKDAPEIYFAGNNLSGDYIQRIVRALEGKDFSVNIISKSGTTTEPAVAFRLFKALLEERYGKEGARARIFATTDKARGALKTLADKEGYECFVIPDDVGGRFSVLTAVGLLPIAAAGIDIVALMAGAAEQMALAKKPTMDNPALVYAAARSVLYREGKKIEVLASFDPDFVFMAEWWKQLYGESEGKEHKGLFPASVSFTADLHSMGQYMQEGERILLETFVRTDTPTDGLRVPHDPEDGDGMNFVSGKLVEEINDAAREGTILAHRSGGVPCLGVDMGAKNAKNLGALIYFFEYACGLSGYLLGVNPFDQPGVESYKRNMFALLGKAGYTLA